MRVSFASGREMTSAPPPACAVALTSSVQQPMPAMVNVVLSFRQWPCGTSTPGGVAEPGCLNFGGSAYVSTLSTLLLRLRAGTPFSDDVFDSVHPPISFNTQAPPNPATGVDSSPAAFHLLNN